MIKRVRQAHLPGYLASYEKLKELNVDIIAFVSVADTFVMTAWGKDQNVEDKVGHRCAESERDGSVALDFDLGR